MFIVLAASREHWSREDQQKERWHNDKNIPEWSKTDDVFEPDSGTFDASGAFCVSKVQYDLFNKINVYVEVHLW